MNGNAPFSLPGAMLAMIVGTSLLALLLFVLPNTRKHTLLALILAMAFSLLPLCASVFHHPR